MANLRREEPITIPITLEVCTEAVCQSLTGCVLARATEAVVNQVVTVGMCVNPDDEEDAIIQAAWQETTEDGVVVRKWRGDFKPLGKAFRLYALNDDGQREVMKRLVTARNNITLRLENVVSWSPGPKTTKPSPPKNLAYTAGYQHGSMGYPCQIPSRFPVDREVIAGYARGFEMGEKRRLSGQPARKKHVKPKRLGTI